MTKTIVCYFRPNALLLDFPEFWRKECDLHLSKAIGANEIVLSPDDIESVYLNHKEEKSQAETLIIKCKKGFTYVVNCNTRNVDWFNTLAKTIVAEFKKGGNDFIYYYDESNKFYVNRRIVCAAMRVDGKVVLGARHGSPLMLEALDHIFKGDQHQEIEAMKRERIEGFIDQYDQFWDRKQALTIAICAGQVRKRTYDKVQLWSEDVW